MQLLDLPGCYVHQDLGSLVQNSSLQAERYKLYRSQRFFNVYLGINGFKRIKFQTLNTQMLLKFVFQRRHLVEVINLFFLANFPFTTVNLSMLHYPSMSKPVGQLTKWEI